jgi:hypothetical protein
MLVSLLVLLKLGSAQLGSASWSRLELLIIDQLGSRAAKLLPTRGGAIYKTKLVLNIISYAEIDTRLFSTIKTAV